MREWLNRLRDRFRRDELDAELSEELAFHRAQLERDAIHAGASPAEAAQAARRALGSELSAREAARERWTLPALEHVVEAVRLAVRGLVRAPGFTLTVVLTLGLGIGANATMFGAVDQLMFRPLAYLRDPGRVHRIYYRWIDRGRLATSQSNAFRRHLDLADWTSSFSQVAGFAERNLPVGDGTDLRDTRVGTVTASYFALFDAPPVQGRYFTAEEDRPPRGADVAVLSHAYWRSEFGGRDVVGTMIQVGNVRAQVIGVAPPGFAGVNDADPPALWVPITTFAGSAGGSDARTYYSTYSWGFMNTLVRLKPGVSLAQAEADATQAFGRSWQAQAAEALPLPSVEVAQPQVTISSVRPGGGPDPALEARTAWWVLVVAAIVLVIAAANVANLVVARALRRQQETAVRLALGAGTGRLVLHSIAEALVLALLIAGAALLFAGWSGAAIASLLNAGPATAPRELADWRTFGVTLAIALVVGAALGALPVLLLRRGDLTAALRGGARSGANDGKRIRGALLAVQGALSTVLLVGAALFVQSLSKVKAMSMGYEPDRVLVVNSQVRGGFPGDTAMRAMIAQVVAAAQAMPEVESAAWASSVPFLSTSNVPVFLEDRDSTGALGTFTYQVTTPDYFRTMGTRILRGRGLADEDRMGSADVTVVSEGMARALWPGRDPIGRCIRMRADTMPCITVVGVAEDMVQRDLAATQRLHYYIPLAQSRRTHGNLLLLRVRGEPAALAERLRQELRRAITLDVFLTATPLATVVQGQQRSWRLGATMFGAFGLLALLVAAVGLHGVIAYDVAQRRHELAVRVALGAKRDDILRMVMGRGVRLVLVGAAVGVAVAAYAGRWIEPLLFRQKAVDPLTYAAVAAVIALVAVVASAVPAWRAAAADPAAALRAE